LAAALWLRSDPALDAGAADAMFDTYCVTCHNAAERAGELRLDDKQVARVADDAETWERVVRKLTTGMMPPAGEPRPERAKLAELAHTLEQALDRAAETRPLQARTALRRLNRTEYANAIRDLLELDVDAATLLPLDDSSEGFDNIATALGTSPSLAEAYVSAAMKLSRLALGDRTAPQTQVAFTVPDGLEQDRHLDGLPLGTRGGFRFDYTFPVDAEYVIRTLRGFGRGGGGGGVDLTIDGSPVSFGNGGQARVRIPAGPHTLTAALLDMRRSSGVDDVYSAPVGAGGIQGIEIDGPLNATGVADTPSRRRILSCRPTSPAEEEACAHAVVAELAQRAFRRPLAAEELAPLLEFYAAGHAAGGFEEGIEQALARVLVDPRFLYRIEAEPDGVAAGAVYEVDDFALATRLSFFLWSSMPDDALLAVAAAGRLREPAVLEAETRRMLADPKAAALVDNFASQWLFLRELESATPDAEAFDENLRSAMLRETELVLDAVLREDLSVLRLLDADFTFIDERLARHYGIPDVRGSHFRKIAMAADDPRRGLLGHASILTLTSVTNRTSPVIRGRFVLEALLGSPAPVPPPNVETTLEGDDGAAATTSVRERLEAHRANPVCASCHAVMDPIGFALEPFDLIGAWRDTDEGRPIDARATLTDGTVVDGPATLKAALLNRSEAFVSTVTEKLMTYALGRRLEYYDMPAVRAIVRDAAAEDHSLSALVVGIVRSEQFRTHVKGAND
jgi:hypothetical protein